MSRFRILITNDDSIHAPGLRYLCSVLKDYADVYIVAPETEQSGVGMSLTTLRALNVKEYSWDGVHAWSVDGTPADCVKMAWSLLLPEKPDLIVSGINNGLNPGRSVLYSGTVGGVIEALYRGVPGIAFSQARHEDFCVNDIDAVYEGTREYILSIIQYIRKNPLSTGSFLNVNFPCSGGYFKGVKFAVQGRGYHVEKLKQTGPSSYWLGCDFCECDEPVDSEITLLREGYITATPLQVSSVTDHTAVRSHKNKFDQYMAESLAVSLV
jgi:5'-nucleotidase